MTRRTSLPGMGQRANVLSLWCVTALPSCSISRGAIKFRPSRNRPAGFSRCTRPGAPRSPSGGCDNGRSSARRSNCYPATRRGKCWDRTPGSAASGTGAEGISIRWGCRDERRTRVGTGGSAIVPGNQPERLKFNVAERLQRLWPQIGPVEFDYVWNGYVGMTTDSFPRIHRLGRNAYGWTGCNGRAVALSIALGDELSKAVRGVPEKHLALPFSDPAPIVAHGLLRRLAPLMLILYRRRDAREIA